MVIPSRRRRLHEERRGGEEILTRKNISSGKAHGEYFGAIRPATTMVEVSRLISPEMLVEIEAEAIVGPPGAAPSL